MQSMYCENIVDIILVGDINIKPQNHWPKTHLWFPRDNWLHSYFSEISVISEILMIQFG